MKEEKPRLIIVAGANGSGKTTFAVPYTEQIGVQFLNADEFAKEFADGGEDNAMIKGGRKFFQRLNAALAARDDVVIETTLSGSYTHKVAKRAVSLGYVVEMIYIYLDNPDVCVERVRLRVDKGGHDVREEDIRRRYYRSVNNFREHFQHFCDEWVLFYNGTEGFLLVADKESVIDSERLSFFNQIAKT